MRTPNFMKAGKELAQKMPVLVAVILLGVFGTTLLWLFQPFSSGSVTRNTIEGKVGRITPIDKSIRSSLSAMQNRILQMEQMVERTNQTAAQDRKALVQKEAERVRAIEQAKREQAKMQGLLDQRLEAAMRQANQSTQAVQVNLPPPPKRVQPRPLRQILPHQPPSAPEVNVLTLPLGSVAQGLLVHGTFASVSKQRGGIPTTFRVTGNFRTPNGRTVQLKKCHIVGNAVGRTSAARAEVELKNIACVDPDDRAWSAKIKGYVTGRDNVLGIPGHLETRDPEKLQRLLLAALSALPGQLVESANSRTSAVGPIGVFTEGGIAPLEDVSREAAQLFIDEARQYSSVLWVRPHQRVYLYILNDLQIPTHLVDVHHNTARRNAID